MIQVNLGKSWLFEFLKKPQAARAASEIATEIIASAFSVQTEKSVDAHSGMTVNLTTINRWWEQSQDLTHQTWSSQELLLQAMAQRWEAWLKAENCGPTSFQLQSLTGTGCELTRSKISYFTENSLAVTEKRGLSKRRCRLTSAHPIEEADLGELHQETWNFGNPASLETALNRILRQNTNIEKVQIWDSLQQFIEFEVSADTRLGLK
jgi:hypothetical protein